ncbi:MAG: hypothetical protein ABEH38_03705 [Flavobacteriales bacterium]
MRIPHLLSLALVPFIFLPSKGQDTTQGQGNEKALSFGLNAGLRTAWTSSGSLKSFQERNPNSDLLNRDLSHYKNTSNKGTMTTPELSLSFGKGICEKEEGLGNLNPRLRIGLSFFSGAGVESTVSSGATARVDTLRSNTSDRELYVDSLHSERYSMSRRSDHLRLSASLLLGTAPEARWSFYGGLGLKAGISFNNRTRIFYSETGRKTLTSKDGSTYRSKGFEHLDGERETFRNKPGFGASAYLPIGVDLRLGKDGTFLEGFHLFYQASPAMNLTYSKETGSLFNPSLTHGLGLRYRWG